MHIGKISGNKIYTNEELLKMNPISGKLAREITELEQRYEKMYGKKKQKRKTIKVKLLLEELKSIPEISFEKRKKEYFIKHKGKTICRVADRKYGISIGMRKNEKYVTIKATDKKELEYSIKEIKEEIK